MAIVPTIANQQESSVADQIANLYRDVLGREPDPEGLQYWINEFAPDNIFTDAEKNIFNTSAQIEIANRPAPLDIYRFNQPDTQVYDAAVSESFKPELGIYGGTPIQISPSESNASDAQFRDRLVSNVANPYIQERYDAAFKPLDIYRFNQPDIQAIDDVGVDVEGTLTKLYRDTLGREPDPEGLRYWMNEFGKDGIIDAQEIETFKQSAQVELNSQAAEEITNLYRDVLGRRPDADGLEYWINEFGKDGVVDAQEIEIFKQAAQPEFANRENLISIFTDFLGREPTADELKSYLGITDPNVIKQKINETGEPLKIFSELLELGLSTGDPDFGVAAKRYAKELGYSDSDITNYINNIFSSKTRPDYKVTEEEVKNVLFQEDIRDAIESPKLTREQFETLSRYYGNDQLVNESRVPNPDRFNAPITSQFVNSKTGVEFAAYLATRTPQFGGEQDAQARYNKLFALTAPYIGTPVDNIISTHTIHYDGYDEFNYYLDKGDQKQILYASSSPDGSFTLRDIIGNETIDGTVRYQLAIKYRQDPQTGQFTIAGPDIEFYQPRKRNFVSDIAPFVAFAALPFAPQLGAYLYGLSGAAAAAAGAATISAGTQLAATGKVDPLRVALSGATGYIGYNTGLTGADIASDAAQLASQGLDATQIASTIAATGVNQVTATVAANLAVAGVSAAVAPLITAGSINMAMAGLNAAATGGDISDSMKRGALTGAGSELSNSIVDDMIGTNNINAIAQSTGLTQNQVRNIGVASISEAFSAEVNKTGDFSKTLGTSLVANGMSFAAANQVVKSFNSTVSDKARAAIVSAVSESTNIATRAAIDGQDIGQVLNEALPFILAKAGVAAIRTPEEKKKIENTITSLYDENLGRKPDSAGLKYWSEEFGADNVITDEEKEIFKQAAKSEINERAINKAPVVTNIPDGSGFNTPEEAMKWANSQGEDKVVWKDQVYKKNEKPTGIPDGSGFTSAQDAIKWANSMGENKVVWEGQTYQNKTLTETFAEIDSAKNFGEAYSKARAALGPNAVFDWNGNRYTTDTKEESVSRADAQLKIKNVESSKEVANTIAKDASLINLKDDKDTGGIFEYVNQKFFNGAFTLQNAKDTPILGTVIKAIAAQQGLGFDAVGNQIKDFATTQALVTNTSFDNALNNIGNNLVEMGKGLGSEEYNKKINSAGQSYMDLANTPRADGLGKSLWEKTTDFVSVAKENPQGAFGYLFTEIAQETIPLGAAATVVLLAPASIPLGATILAATTVGATLSATIDAAEVYGNVGKEEYDYEIGLGKTDEQARSIANQRAAVASMITLVTEGVADKTIIDAWSSSLAKGVPNILGTGVRVVAANYLGEYVENWGHNLSSAMSRGEELTSERLNQIASESQLEAIVGGKTAGVLISPIIANGIVAKATDGSDISFDQLVGGSNKPVASINYNFPVNVLPNGDQLTLGGVTEILRGSDVGIELSTPPSSVVYVTAGGTAITSAQVTDFANEYNISIPDVFKSISNNQLNTAALDVRLGSTTTSTPQADTVVTTTINPDTGNIVNVNTETNKDTGVVTETITETDSSTGTVVDNTITTDPTTNVVTDNTVTTDPTIDTTTESNVTTSQDSVVTNNTVTNPNVTTNIDTTTDTNTNTTTTIATQTDTNTNTTTDITVKVQTELDKIVDTLVNQGVPVAEAVKIAVKEVTENANNTTAARRSGSGFIPALGLPMLGSDSDFEHGSLYTRGPIQEFKSPLETYFEQIEAADELKKAESSPQPKEEQMDTSDYFAYGQERDIDSILGGDIVSGVFDSMDGSVFPRMKSGGLVPAFRSGGYPMNNEIRGPLTLAAGKVRKDYRQGDAVSGPGDGQSDDIPAMLADGEFVMPADVVAALGNGSNKAGADKLYEMMHSIRREHRKGKPQDLPKPAKSPLQYIKRRA